MVQSIIEAETGEKQRSHQINLNRFSVMEEEFVVGVQLFFFFFGKVCAASSICSSHTTEETAVCPGHRLLFGLLEEIIGDRC